MTAIAIEVVRKLPDTLDDLFPEGSALVRVVVSDAAGGPGKKFRFVYGPAPENKLLTQQPAEAGLTPRLVELAQISVLLDRARKPDPAPPGASQ